ncbi:peptidase inhibitor family I36 protein [Streptomyces sp. NPDC058425]|uniref:peptidase inhibitor family I36 protein n=1 Tax=unclassified Streptomyces TaxID=2593676 RepID=UPI003650D750
MTNKFAAAGIAILLALTAAFISVTSNASPGKASADDRRDSSVSAQRGPTGGPVCVFNDHNFSGEFTGFFDAEETARHCFRSDESIGHFGSLQNEVDDNISSISNSGRKTMCFYRNPDFTGLALEVHANTRLNLDANGRFAIFNDEITSMRPC